MRDLADWLLAYETTEEHRREVPAVPVLQVFRKLHSAIDALAGSAGFHSLLRRALTLAQREERVLSAVQLREDGSLDGLGSISGAAVADASSVLLAHFLELLTTFFGGPLTFRLLHGIWPALPDSSLLSLTPGYNPGRKDE